MYHKFDSIEAYRAAIYSAIDDVMWSEVKNNAIEALQKSIRECVYNSYFPKFHNRRMEAGGLSARENLTPTYFSETKTLYIEADAPWQNLGTMRSQGGVGTYGGDLSDVIEQDGMYGAGPRPFAEQAEQEYGTKKFARDLQHGLIMRGL